jgi:LemA protein
MVSDLMDELTNTEDRIELMRAGFNKSVERYNNRLRTFPEVFIANAFGFKGASFFRPTVDDEASSP